jgi:MarR family transcriptional regulator for hemolysin
MADPIPEFLLLLKALPRDWRAVIDRRLAPLGLSQAKWQPLLFLLRAEAPPTQAEIARHLDIESPTLVRLLDRLADDGWIERKNCAGDRRARRIHLTPRAQAVGAEIESIVGEVRRQLLQKISSAELRESIELLRRVHDNALRMLDETPLTEPSKPVAHGRKRRA